MKKAHPNETKADAFRRIAGRRLAEAVEAIRKLENLANTQAYEYTPKQVSDINLHLERAVIQVANVFEGKVEKERKFIEL